MKSFKTDTTTTLRSTGMAHLTVSGRNVVGVENALIQPFLFYYVNHVFLMLTGIFEAKFP